MLWLSVSHFRKREGRSCPSISVIFLVRDKLPWVIHPLDQLEVWCHHSLEFLRSNKEWDLQCHHMVIIRLCIFLSLKDLFAVFFFKIWNVTCHEKQLFTNAAVPIKKKMNSLHLKCFVYRSVWCSSPGHARLSSWSNASLWSGTSDGAPVPKWTSSTSNGNETSCHVARWPLLMLLHTL